jgi:hypothetical protein
VASPPDDVDDDASEDGAVDGADVLESAGGVASAAGATLSVTGEAASTVVSTGCVTLAGSSVKSGIGTSLSRGHHGSRRERPGGAALTNPV